MKTVLDKYNTIAIIHNSSDRITPYVVTSGLYEGHPIQWAGGTYYTTLEDAFKDYKERVIDAVSIRIRYMEVLS